MTEKKSYPPKSVDDPMPFGKYKDEPIWQIMQNDPNYMDWLLSNTDFELDDEGWEYWQKLSTGRL